MKIKSKVFFLLILCVSIVVSRIWLINNQNDAYKKISRLLGAPEVIRTISISSKEVSFQAPSNNPIYYSIISPNKFSITPHVIINNHDWSTISSVKSEIFHNTASDSASMAFSLWNFVSTNISHAPPSVRGVNQHTLYSELRNPLQMLNSWGYAYCDDIATVLAQLGRLSGISTRLVDGNSFHEATEFFYDNKWHLYDADRQMVYDINGNVASYEEVRNNLELIKTSDPGQVRGYFSDIKKLQQDYFTSPNPIYRYLDDKYQTATKFAVQLDAHEEIRYFYNWQNKYYWSQFSDIPPGFTNGFLISPISIRGQLNNIFGKPYKIWLPYPIVGMYLVVPQCFVPKVLVSIENGQLRDIKNVTCLSGVVDLSKYIPKGPNSYPSHTLSISLPFSLPSGFIVTQFQLAQNSLPVIVKGNNIINQYGPLADVIIGY